ncbi:MAG: glutathione peroxidase [Anaerorhabdus sp.]|uniref:glutathione peroxidase n=1 Tax=Anaerorhabdus sp. TaxID=1872524 RepID=UPI002FC76921
MIYDYSVKNQEGEDISLERYKGNVLLIVNTATGCGFTPQYQELQELYEKYHLQGFEILDFPCNQFHNQAPGTDSDIHEFCTRKYHVTFPQFSKIEVNGEHESPLYTYLKNSKKGLLSNNIKWNFTKFLVDRDGQVIKRFAPNINPSQIEEDIVKLL